MKKKYLNAGYARKYDSYFNLDTFEWLEAKCEDSACLFCANRPDMAKGLDFDVHKNVTTSYHVD